ncbi:hypothetical protein [Lutibacter sp.]|uniref:hypothetical protein n=1 Tax=Lutibacter sp. TaxID=1925666 RepID=UPI0025C1186E|nr:hypothetical protein [Lutibacter sp.]MCF6180789.1 hypothetical protein [Lutibacter sp.]
MFLALSTIIISCNKKEYTGESQLVPSSPTLTTSLDFTSPVTLVEDDSEYTYTVTLSEPQIVDVKLHVQQVGGSASADDYEMTTTLVIPAGYTTATGSIKILTDDLVEDTETLKLQIGDERVANASFSPVDVDFNILNYTSGDLTIDMSWDMATATTDNSGEAISPTDFADMRLLITDGPNNTNILGSADGGSFETFVLPGGAPDGDYYVVADFYDANADIVRDLNLNLEFNQPGVINGESFSFPNAINNESLCPNNYFVLTKITKVGQNYTFENIAKPNFSSTSYTGDDAGYPNEVITGADCDGLTISGIAAGWFPGYWNEIVTDAGTVYYTVDSNGVVDIPQQYLYSTTWNGSPQPSYDIVGSGTYDAATGVLVLQYKLIQAGADVIVDYGLTGDYPDGYFHATLTAN